LVWVLEITMRKLIEGYGKGPWFIKHEKETMVSVMMADSATVLKSVNNIVQYPCIANHLHIRKVNTLEQF
jgi:hypothetical protein